MAQVPARENREMPELTAHAVLFDMDGTLVDSTPAVVRVWSRFADSFGLSIDQIMAESHGVRMIETVRRHAPDGTDIDDVVRDLSHFELHDRDGITAVPGAAALLSALPPERVALVTSASRELAVARMAAAGLELPAVLVTAEDVQRGKPSPECYRLAAERLGVDPATCVVFEDADAGIRAGLAAGATVVVIGDLHGDAGAGLIRIADYTGVNASRSTEGIVLDLS